jgi:uncharacterized membrane protein
MSACAMLASVPGAEEATTAVSPATIAPATRKAASAGRRFRRPGSVGLRRATFHECPRVPDGSSGLTRSAVMPSSSSGQATNPLGRRRSELSDSLLIQRTSHLSLEPNPVLLEHARQRAESVQNRIADQITTFAGSMAFVYIHIVWFGCWIGFGVEKYPYGLLTMIVSLEAIFLSTFVMISQNRADAKRQVIADQQWQTVKEEDSQNRELLDLSNQILELTKAVHAATAARSGGRPEVRG